MPGAKRLRLGRPVQPSAREAAKQPHVEADGGPGEYHRLPPWQVGQQQRQPAHGDVHQFPGVFRVRLGWAHERAAPLVAVTRRQWSRRSASVRSIGMRGSQPVSAASRAKLPGPQACRSGGNGQDPCGRESRRAIAPPACPSDRRCGGRVRCRRCTPAVAFRVRRSADRRERCRGRQSGRAATPGCRRGEPAPSVRPRSRRSAGRSSRSRTSRIASGPRG